MYYYKIKIKKVEGATENKRVTLQLIDAEGHVALTALAETDGIHVDYPINKWNCLVELLDDPEITNFDAWAKALKSAVTRAAAGKINVGGTACGAHHYAGDIGALY